MARKRDTQDVFDARKTKETHNLTPHPVTGRLIDNHPGTRRIPMRVLVLGASRTGTMSIYAALETLGYKPYHMAKAIQAPKSNLDVWSEGIEAKHNYPNAGKLFGREEFDKIMGDYDACADVPTIYFSEELITAYPEAKIIIQTRDVDRWLKSMDATAGTVMRWSRSWEFLAPYDPSLVGPFWRHAKNIMQAMYHTLSDFSPETSPARNAFEQHYEMLKRVAPKERTLEYTVQEGWGPLCEFLGHPVPEQEEFPNFNDARQFIVAHNVMWYLAFSKFVAKTSWISVPIIGLGVAIWQERIPNLW